MKLAYVIGPLTADTIHQRLINVRRAETVAAELWKAGFAVICPHLNSHTLGGVVPEQTFIDGDLEMISRCDFCVVVEGECSTSWMNSKGSIQEVNFCTRMNIPVHYTVIEAIVRETDA